MKAIAFRRATVALSCVSAALVAVLAPSESHAHQSSMTYGSLTTSPDRRVVHYQLKINAGDLFEALELEADRPASAAEITNGGDRLVRYVLDRVILSATPGPCEPMAPKVEVLDQSARFAVIHTGLRCQQPVQQINLDYDLFFDLDERHTGLITVDGELVQLRLPDDTILEYTLGDSTTGGAASFVWSGVEHIIYGPDHILFLMGLLVVVSLARQSQGDIGLRSLRQSASYTVKIVTSFTVAHSLTLIAASLGWMELSSRLVESLIALSILFIAVENIVQPDPKRRVIITFGFGLAHGLGFATMLRPLLPPDAVVGPLLAFNIGVEAGQLAIVLLALPILHLLANRLGANRYRRRVVFTASVLLVAAGAVWLAERALGLELPAL